MSDTCGAYVAGLPLCWLISYPQPLQAQPFYPSTSIITDLILLAKSSKLMYNSTMTTLPLYVSQWMNSGLISSLSRDSNPTSSLRQSYEPFSSSMDLAKATARPYNLVNALDEAASSAVGIEWPKPCPHFPVGSPDVVWYYSPSPRTWDPSSEPREWPWPAGISRAFLDGNLGWIEAVNGRPAYVKINIERDDLLEYFASDERRASRVAFACQAPHIPIIRIERPDDFEGKLEAELKETKPRCGTSANGNILQNIQGKAVLRLTPEVFKLPTDNQGDAESELWVELQGREASRMPAEGKADQSTKSRDQENDAWFIVDEDDYEESWERVSRRPTRCGSVVWDKLPERRRKE